MIRRLTLALALALAALGVASGSALAGGKSPVALPQVGQAGNNDPMPCVGLLDPYSGSINTFTTVTKTSGKPRRDGIEVSISAGLLVTVQPNDPAGVSFIGTEALDETVLVPTGAQMAQLPVTIPLLGSDGSATSVVSVELVFAITPAAGGKLEVVAVTGDVSCAPGVVPVSSGAPLEPDAATAFRRLVDSASGVGAASLLSAAVAGPGASGAPGKSHEVIKKWLDSPYSAKRIASLTATLDAANGQST